VLCLTGRLREPHKAAGERVLRRYGLGYVKCFDEAKCVRSGSVKIQLDIQEAHDVLPNVNIMCMCGAYPAMLSRFGAATEERATCRQKPEPQRVLTMPTGMLNLLMHDRGALLRSKTFRELM
jgi:hypothetical protein